MNENFEDWLDKIRIQMYEEQKGMTNAEIALMINEKAREIAERGGYKFNFVSSNDMDDKVLAK